MIRVLHSVLSLEVGGLENGVVNLVNNMPNDMQVDVLCLRAKGVLAERVVHPRAQVICSATMEDHSIRSALKAHWQQLKRHNYDIIHTHGWATLLSGALSTWLLRLKTNSKRPLIINGEHGVYYADQWRKKLAQKMLFKAIDGNLSVSADLGKRMEYSFGLGPTFHPILNGVDTQQFKPQPKFRLLQRQKLGLTPENLVIGTVGRLVKIKNYPLLIESFRQLHQSNPLIRLVFCGDGEQRSHLEALVQSAGLTEVVYFTGRIQNVAEVMQAFDIFTLTSDMEGLPNTLLEAMASKTPCVVTDVGGSREVLAKDAGILVPPGDIQLLTKALKALILDPKARLAMAQQAFNHVHEHLTLQKMADQYYDYYRQILA